MCYSLLRYNVNSGQIRMIIIPFFLCFFSFFSFFSCIQYKCFFLLKVFVFLQNRYFFFVYCFFTIFLKQNNFIVSRCLISKLLFFYFFFRFSLFLSMKMWVGFFFNICLKFTPNICYIKEIWSSK